MNPRLILGSASPRRRDLLEGVGLRHEVLKPDVEEKPRPGEQPTAYALRNAHEKAHWVKARVQGPAIVISADTIVVLGDAILEKPRDADDAAVMLRRLSGTQHAVVSGVSLLHTDGRESRFAVETKVWVKTLTAQDVAEYVRSGEPLDKAGAYAVQGLGAFMVTRIEGSYPNVVGLPVAEVVQALETDFAYSLWRRT